MTSPAFVVGDVRDFDSNGSMRGVNFVFSGIKSKFNYL
jgi:hypothetical protein